MKKIFLAGTALAASNAMRTPAASVAIVLHGLLAGSAAFTERDISAISLCSTVPSVLREMREMCERYYGDRETVIVEPGVKTGVPVRTDNPKEVGSDRIMNSLAAVHLYGGPAIVVDFGTSTNFDAVSARGEFVGGALAPGIEISVDALSRRAAQLLKVELTRPPRVIGKNTVESLQSGIIYGFAAQVEGIAQRMARELSPDDPRAVTTIATGGLAPLGIVTGMGGGIRAPRAMIRSRAEATTAPTVSVPGSSFDSGFGIGPPSP